MSMIDFYRDAKKCKRCNTVILNFPCPHCNYDPKKKPRIVDGAEVWG